MPFPAPIAKALEILLLYIFLCSFVKF